MYKVRVFPGANTTAQWYETLFDRGTFSKVDKFLLHTTETLGWPGYDGGAKAPTITYHPKLRQFRQHNFINKSARALVDLTSTPVRENRDNVVQIEIICYADGAIADSVGGLKVSELTDDNLRDLARLFKWLHDEWGTPLVCNYEFPAYRPYRNVRLTSSQYDAAVGLLGHCHVSGNTHTDPGDINAKKILSYAIGVTTVPEALMALEPADVDKIVNAIASFQIVHPDPALAKAGATVPWKTSAWSGNQYAWLGYVNTQEILKALGVDNVDEAAIANAVLAGLKPDIIGAVESAFASVKIDANVTPEEIAAISSAVVTELNSRLAS